MKAQQTGLSDGAGAPGGDRVIQAVLWMMAATLLFVIMDTIAKHLSQTYSIFQVVWARYFFHFVFLLALFRGRTIAIARTQRLPLQLMRSCLLIVITCLFFAGLSFLQLATATAIMLLSPIVVTALSVPLLKERVGPRRWAGVVCGFCGALIIIRPGSDVFDLAALLPLTAAALYALYQIATRELTRSDSPQTTIFYTALAGSVVCSLAVPFFWTAPGLYDLGLMLLLGLIGGVSHFALIKAFGLASAATISPLGYLSLVWATLFGFLVFGEFPDLATLAGAAIIIASGIYILFRERRLAAR